jgi:hypothetical protein
LNIMPYALPKGVLIGILILYIGMLTGLLRLELTGIYHH